MSGKTAGFGSHGGSYASLPIRYSPLICVPIKKIHAADRGQTQTDLFFMNTVRSLSVFRSVTCLNCPWPMPLDHKTHQKNLFVRQANGSSTIFSTTTPRQKPSHCM